MGGHAHEATLKTESQHSGDSSRVRGSSGEWSRELWTTDPWAPAFGRSLCPLRSSSPGLVDGSLAAGQVGGEKGEQSSAGRKEGAAGLSAGLVAGSCSEAGLRCGPGKLSRGWLHPKPVLLGLERPFGRSQSVTAKEREGLPASCWNMQRCGVQRVQGVSGFSSPWNVSPADQVFASSICCRAWQAA